MLNGIPLSNNRHLENLGREPNHFLSQRVAYIIRLDSSLRNCYRCDPWLDMEVRTETSSSRQKVRNSCSRKRTQADCRAENFSFSFWATLSFRSARFSQLGASPYKRMSDWYVRWTKSHRYVHVADRKSSRVSLQSTSALSLPRCGCSFSTDSSDSSFLTMEHLFLWA